MVDWNFYAGCFETASHVAIVGGTVVGIATLIQHRKQAVQSHDLDRELAKRSHTLDILLSRFAGGTAGKNLATLAKWELEKKSLPKGREDYEEIKEAFNLYEFISAAARQGILDVDLLYEVRGWAMMRTYDHFTPYIEKRRTDLNNQKIWEHYQWFVDEVVRERRPQLQAT